MRRLLIYLSFCLLAGASLVTLMDRDPGYVLLAWHEWQLETSIWLAMLFLLLLGWSIAWLAGNVAGNFERLGKESVYSESIETREDGVNDLIFSVASLDSEINKLESKGVELYRRSDDGKSAFFDTRAEGNIMIRLVQ